MTDPIADMLTRIRNAVGAKRPRVDIPASKVKVEIARILADEGYIQGYKLVEETPEGARDATEVRAHLPEGTGSRGERVITGIERISRPGRRVYFGHDQVPPVLAGLGISILTTSRGLMTGREANRAGIGGEVLCNVW